MTLQEIFTLTSDDFQPEKRAINLGLVQSRPAQRPPFEAVRDPSSNNFMDLESLIWICLILQMNGSMFSQVAMASLHQAVVDLAPSLP